MIPRRRRCHCSLVLYRDLVPAYWGGWWHRCNGWVPPHAYLPPPGKPVSTLTRLRAWLRRRILAS